MFICTRILPRSPRLDRFDMGGGGGVTSVYVRLSHRIQKGQDIGGHRRT